ncbi:MAG TPA: hypothetical protein PKK00_08710 [Bacteroidales bacterium]|nr:hypothetical protein [Bacteroidales bacterium]HPS17448.1 hypothetical protein [Bacteroidales bacterium]
MKTNDLRKKLKCIFRTTIVIIFFLLSFRVNVNSQPVNHINQSTQHLSLLKRSLRYYTNTGKPDTVIKSGDKTETFEQKSIQNKKLSGLLLPEIYISTIKNGNRQVSFSIFIDTTFSLAYDASANKYTGSFKITLLENTTANTEEKKLKKPVSLDLWVNQNVKVSPEKINIDHINYPPTEIKITDQSSDNPVPIKVITSFNSKGYTVHLNKETILYIETDEQSVQGYGVESIPINISLKNFTGNENIKVTISTDKGIVNPQQLTLSKESPNGSVTLTSAGTSKSTIRISANGFADNTKVFMFVFPWMFIIFSLLGGALGAVVKVLMRRYKKNALKNLVLGLLTGFIFAILYYVLGIEIFDAKLNRNINEFAVLGISFLGALFWGTIYNSIGKKLFGQKN